MTNTDVPPIPLWLTHLPTAGGMVVPWLTPRTLDGRWLLGGVDSDKVRLALERRWCGVCGRQLDDDRLVLLVRWSDMAWKRSFEPALHPVCVKYTSDACPMIAGRLDHYRSTPMRLDDTMLPGQDSESRQGARAEPWFSVWLRSYEVVVDHGHPAASYARTASLAIRPIGPHAALAFALGLVPGQE